MTHRIWADGSGNDQPSDLALSHGHKLGGDDLDVPVHQKRRPGVELIETALSETAKIRTQDHVVCAVGKFADHGSPLLAPKPRLQALDDLLVGLGESRIGGMRIAVASDVAEHPQ